MNTAILVIALTVGAGFEGPYPHLERIPQSHTLRACKARHKGYHARLYYGFYEQPLYDYRTQFDYPWHSGPSRYHWPILAPPIPPCDHARHFDGQGAPVEYEALPVEQEILPVEKGLPPGPSPQVKRLPPSSELEETARQLEKPSKAPIANAIKYLKNPLR